MEEIMARKGENIYKRKDGRWEGRYRIPQVLGTKTSYRSVYGHSYREVREKLILRKQALMQPSGKKNTASAHADTGGRRRTLAGGEQD